MDDVDNIPLQSFRRVDGGQDQPVLVEEGRPRQVPGRTRRVERQFRDEPGPRRVPGGEVLELIEVAKPLLWARVEAVEGGGQEPSEAPDLARGWHISDRAIGQGGPQLGEVLVGDGGDARVAVDEPAYRRGSGRIVSTYAQFVHESPRSHGTHAFQELEDAEPAHLVEGVVQDSEQCQHILDVGRLQELQPSVLDVGDVPAGQFDLEQVAVVGSPKQHSLAP